MLCTISGQPSSMTRQKSATSLAEESRLASVCKFSCPFYYHQTNLLPIYFRNNVIQHLETIDSMVQPLEIIIPMQVLVDIDDARNPTQLTRERLERAATENQFMNGKIAAIDVSIRQKRRPGLRWDSHIVEFLMKHCVKTFQNLNGTFESKRRGVSRVE